MIYEAEPTLVIAVVWSGMAATAVQCSDFRAYASIVRLAGECRKVGKHTHRDSEPEACLLVGCRRGFPYMHSCSCISAIYNGIECELYGLKVYSTHQWRIEAYE